MICSFVVKTNTSSSVMMQGKGLSSSLATGEAVILAVIRSSISLSQEIHLYMLANWAVSSHSCAHITGR